MTLPETTDHSMLAAPTFFFLCQILNTHLNAYKFTLFELLFSQYLPFLCACKTPPEGLKVTFHHKHPRLY